MFRILVCDEDREIVHAIELYLTEEGDEVLCAYDGLEAAEAVRRETVHLLIVDIMMPKMDGITVLKKLRREGNTLPVLLLPARDSIEDRVTGLDAGADDYLVKPFAFEELLARLRVLLRKPVTEKSSILNVADLSLHVDTRRVFRGDREHQLSSRSIPCFIT